MVNSRTILNISKHNAVALAVLLTLFYSNRFKQVRISVFPANILKYVIKYGMTLGAAFGSPSGSCPFFLFATLTVARGPQESLELLRYSEWRSC